VEKAKSPCCSSIWATGFPFVTTTRLSIFYSRDIEQVHYHMDSAHREGRRKEQPDKSECRLKLSWALQFPVSKLLAVCCPSDQHRFCLPMRSPFLLGQESATGAEDASSNRAKPGKSRMENQFGQFSGEPFVLLLDQLDATVLRSPFFRPIVSHRPILTESCRTQPRCLNTRLCQCSDNCFGPFF
jgi:hypothetical protein